MQHFRRNALRQAGKTHVDHHRDIGLVLPGGDDDLVSLPELHPLGLIAAYDRGWLDGKKCVCPLRSLGKHDLKVAIFRIKVLAF